MFFEMIINWKEFERKFNGQESAAFEKLARRIFCTRHNLPYVYSYKNQMGIESDPIEVDGKSRGFQAKYIRNISKNKFARIFILI